MLEHQLKIVEERAQKLEEDLRRASPSTAQPPGKPIGMAEVPTITSTKVDEVFVSKPSTTDGSEVNYEVSESELCTRGLGKSICRHMHC